MVDAEQPFLSTARAYPDRVPLLVDHLAGILLRPTQDSDLPAIVELARDAETIRWTAVPTPDGGYRRSDAAEFAAAESAGWRTGRRLGWAIEAERGGTRQFCGHLNLHLEDPGLAEIGFALHPGARGRSIMSTAVRLVRDYGFDVAGLETIRWRSAVGNWGSRQIASAAGFVFDGTVRRWLVQRGERRDAWIATITREDPRRPLRWLVPVELVGAGVMLRGFRTGDAQRIVEACSDERTRYWLISLPRPYEISHALAYLDAAQELPASGSGEVWCVADPEDGRCLGSISLEGLGGYAKRAEIGYWAHPQARGRGVITEAVRLVTEYAEASGRIDSIMIRSAAGNRASRHVAEAAGYRQVGIQPASEPLGDGTLSDLVLYCRP